MDAEPSERTQRLPFRVPFAADALLSFLGARAVPGIEELRDATYLRSVQKSGSAAVDRDDPSHGSRRAPCHRRMRHSIRSTSANEPVGRSISMPTRWRSTRVFPDPTARTARLSAPWHPRPRHVRRLRARRPSDLRAAGFRRRGEDVARQARRASGDPARATRRSDHPPVPHRGAGRRAAARGVRDAARTRRDDPARGGAGRRMGSSISRATHRAGRPSRRSARSRGSGHGHSATSRCELSATRTPSSPATSVSGKASTHSGFRRRRGRSSRGRSDGDPGAPTP